MDAMVAAADRLARAERLAMDASEAYAARISRFATRYAG